MGSGTASAARRGRAHESRNGGGRRRSLLRALHPLPARGLVVRVVRLLLRGLLLPPPELCLDVHRVHRNLLRVLEVRVHLGRGGEGPPQHLQGRGREGAVLREGDLELDVEVPPEARVGPLRHALVLDAVELARPDDLAGAGLDEERPLVEVGDGDGGAAQRVAEGNLLCAEEVVALALENGVLLLLLHHKDEVASLDAGLLVRLAVEHDLLPLGGARLHVDLEHLPLPDDLRTVALGAPIRVSDALARTLADVALALHLLDHARAELPDRDLDPVALAGGAGDRHP
mmetsp:Transcript_34495/g.81778  ORF Transcript_34495/g.81778 Transcript_34495/m.81778 type:complete len:287 (+) Transcript_34495:303-1163(+)